MEIEICVRECCLSLSICIMLIGNFLGGFSLEGWCRPKLLGYVFFFYLLFLLSFQKVAIFFLRKKKIKKRFGSLAAGRIHLSGKNG